MKVMTDRSCGGQLDSVKASFRVCLHFKSAAKSAIKAWQNTHFLLRIYRGFCAPLKCERTLKEHQLIYARPNGN